MSATVAYLIIGITFNSAHRSIDAIEYPQGIAACTKALIGMKATIAARSTSLEAHLTFEPYCTDEKPPWWRDRSSFRSER